MTGEQEAKVEGAEEIAEEVRGRGWREGGRGLDQCSFSGGRGSPTCTKCERDVYLTNAVLADYTNRKSVPLESPRAVKAAGGARGKLRPALLCEADRTRSSAACSAQTSRAFEVSTCLDQLLHLRESIRVLASALTYRHWRQVARACRGGSFRDQVWTSENARNSTLA